MDKLEALMAIERLGIESFEHATLLGVDESDLPEDPQAILNGILDELQTSDSYGVYGSDFTTCHCCGAGGSPYVTYQHTDECPVRIAESALQQWEEWNSQCREFVDGTGI